MESTGVVHSIKGCVGRGYFTGLYYDVTLCHHIVTGRRIWKISSKDDIIFIWSCQLFRVTRYDTGKTVAYFVNNNERGLEIIGRTSLCNLLFILVLALCREIFFFSITTLNITVSNHISDLILKLGYWIVSHPLSYYWGVSWLWGKIRFKTWYN